MPFYYFFIILEIGENMHTQKVAVTIPKDLVALINKIRKSEGLSRSKYISEVLREKLESEKNRFIQ